MKRLLGWLMLFAAMTAVLIGVPYAAGGWQCVMCVWGVFMVLVLLVVWITEAIDLIEDK